jgi:HAD superfamily hydrolase (TIGR01509 family)
MASGALPLNSRLPVAAITLDFGNTLVRVDRPGLRDVVEETADGLGLRGIVEDRDGFLAAWAEERDRQFREEVPEFREVDVGQRAVRVLARLRGVTPPALDARWDDLVAASKVQPEEVDAVVDAYSAAFVRGISPMPDAGSTIEQLAGRGFALAILSNWPLAATIDRFAEAQGWTPHLRAIVVSQRVGTIKPHPAIFRAAEEALGVDESSRAQILHVGDDWAADVVGASQAGWRSAYLRGRQGDTSLPTSEPGDALQLGVRVEPDLLIDELADLDARVELFQAAGRGASAARPGAPSTT